MSIKCIIIAVFIASFVIAYSCAKVAGDADYRAMKMREKEGGIEK